MEAGGLGARGGGQIAGAAGVAWSTRAGRGGVGLQGRMSSLETQNVSHADCTWGRQMPPFWHKRLQFSDPSVELKAAQSVPGDGQAQYGCVEVHENHHHEHESKCFKSLLGLSYLCHI